MKMEQPTILLFSKLWLTTVLFLKMYNLQSGNSVTIDTDVLDDAGVSKNTSLGAYETVDNYADGVSHHDASIEEIFHLITQYG